DWENMWTYHAVASVIRGHSILRNLSEVSDAVGVTGISWGGYVTSLVAGVDTRFACAVPVYGCGFLQDNSADDWLTTFDKMTPERRAWWHDYCDPSVYLPEAKMPMCFVTGTNDFAYPMDSLQKSYRLPQGDVSLSIRLEMAHGHQPGWSEPDIALFADQHCKNGIPLPVIGKMALAGTRVSATFESHTPVTKGELIYTCENDKWQDRKWYAMEAVLSAGEISAVVPDGCTVCYLAVGDNRGAYVSAPHIER
ncbi:MAG: prolyl oligopeptidase family serine peptidase, partial [Candidatus Latescibacteria bacterium]|nr:prolyl oligopeptidase family serine peptidase [Candidatus Latescibacterota bacterium]